MCVPSISSSESLFQNYITLFLDSLTHFFLIIIKINIFWGDLCGISAKTVNTDQQRFYCSRSAVGHSRHHLFYSFTSIYILTGSKYSIMYTVSRPRRPPSHSACVVWLLHEHPHRRCAFLQSAAVKLFKPKHHLGHPEYYLFLLSKIYFLV